MAELMSPKEGSSGLLILPASINGNSIRNTLNVLFSPVIHAKYDLPEIKAVTFLKTPDVSEIRVDGEGLSFGTAVEKLVGEVDPNLEVRNKPVTDYAQDVPNVIMSAVREFGKESLILDLTVGKKDITGSLYTSACIAQIKNMVYVDVKRDSTGNFPAIKADDKDICQKVKVTQFQTISEIERLASLNYMDFVIYKKMVDELVPSHLEKYHELLDTAIGKYFSKDADGFRDSIRNIGLINEELRDMIIGHFRVNEAFNEYIKACTKEKCHPLKVLQHIQSLYEDSAVSKQRNQNETLKRRYENLAPFFRYFPALFEMISMIANYRNLVSHTNDYQPQRDDAKLVLDTMLRIFRSLKEVKFFEGMSVK